ncbi:MAG: hypothetical protein AAFY84_12730 [Pseudomonadota bacterium]
MSDNTGKAPISTHRDGAVSIKVFRNEDREGYRFYGAKIAKAYKDRETGEFRDTNTFSANDLLKLNALVPQAQRLMVQEHEMDKKEGLARPPRDNLESKREETMARAVERSSRAEEGETRTRPSGRTQ